MKKLICLLLGLMLVFALAACGEPETDDGNTGSAESVAAAVEGDADDWEKFLDDYEKWVDDYVALMEKYEQNPTDMSILNEYTEMLSDLTEWSNNADDISAELAKSPEDLAEYTKRLGEILEKLTGVIE